MTVSEDFTNATGRFRGELLAHCYRMLGSADEAEDLVQETYLRAWRSYAGFEGRASVRQRAVLILRDVLEWPAAQVADLLGTTTTAVNSGLRRARAQVAGALPAEDELAEPDEPDRRAMLDRFAAAVENADASALAQLLAEDVALEMPPALTWFAGRQAVTGFTASRLFTEPGGLRLVLVMANG